MTKSGFRVAFDGNTATLADESTTTISPEMVEKTTRTRALAVALRDAGKTNAEIGALMGTTSGSAGNNVTNGLRDLGRESEVTSTNGGNGGGSRGPSANPVDVAEAALERAREAKANLGDTVKKAEAERKAFLADAKARNIDYVVPEGVEPSPVQALLIAHHDRMDAKVTAAKAGVRAREAELAETITKWEAAVTALKAVA